MKFVKSKLMILSAIICTMFIAPCYGENGGKILEGDPKSMDTLSYSLGVAYAATIKADSVIGVFDLNAAKLNEGIRGVLTDSVKMSSAECHRVLDSLSAKIKLRIAESAANSADASAATAQVKPYDNDEERDNFSYVLGNCFAIEFKKVAIRDAETIHYYWVCKAFEDVYAGTLALSGEQMLAFLKKHTTKVPDVEGVKPQE